MTHPMYGGQVTGSIEQEILVYTYEKSNCTLFLTQRSLQTWMIQVMTDCSQKRGQQLLRCQVHIQLQNDNILTYTLLEERCERQLFMGASVGCQ